jgi:hypothetical protein
MMVFYLVLFYFQVHVLYFQMTGVRCTSITDIVVQITVTRTETIM